MCFLYYHITKTTITLYYDIYQEYDDVIINNDATIFVFVLTINPFVLIFFFFT